MGAERADLRSLGDAAARVADDLQAAAPHAPDVQLHVAAWHDAKRVLHAMTPREAAHDPYHLTVFANHAGEIRTALHRGDYEAALKVSSHSLQALSENVLAPNQRCFSVALPGNVKRGPKGGAI